MSLSYARPPLPLRPVSASSARQPRVETETVIPCVPLDGERGTTVLPWRHRGSLQRMRRVRGSASRQWQDGPLLHAIRRSRS